MTSGRAGGPDARATTRIVRFADIPPTRWATGLGETREIALEPRGAGFLWRISIATIAGPSEFSPLPGIDRRLMNLGDMPLGLVRSGEQVVLEHHQVLSFSGEDAVRVDSAGTGYDLNLMTARGAARGRLDLVSASGARSFSGGDDTVIAIVALGDGLSALAEGVAIPLSARDCVIGAPGVWVEVHGEGLAALIRIVVQRCIE